MKLCKLFLASLGFISLAFGQNATLENLENALLRAKANYDQNANQTNLEALQQAEIQYQNYFLTLPKPVRGTVSRAQTPESEPNQTAATASGPLAPGTDSGTGGIDPAGDRDFWRIDPLNVGDLLFVVVDPEFGGGTDTEMSVFSNDGTTLLEFDDDSGDGLASAVVTTVTTAGSAYAEINEFGDNGVINPYELFSFTAAPGTAVAEVEPNDAFGTATSITNGLMSGDLAGSDDFFSFGATAGDRIVVIGDNDPNGNANNADIEIAILDTDGTTVLGSEAPFTVTSQNAALATATNTGTHFVSITDGGSGDGDTDYRFAIIVGGTPVPVELQSFSIE